MGVWLHDTFAGGHRLKTALPMALNIVRAALVLFTSILGVLESISHTAAQGPTIGVAYVEAVTGRAIASSQGTMVELEILDIIDDGTWLELDANAELRICHYRVHKRLALRGPLRASISAAGLRAEDDNAVAAWGEACAAPVVTTVQGGFFRSVERATKVALRPIIKIANRGTKSIRRTVLREGTSGTIVTTFDHNVGQPQLVEGQTYFLVIELGDGGEWKMMLQASAATDTRALIVVIP